MSLSRSRVPRWAGLTHLDVAENIFECEGEPGDEIAHIFGVESAEIDALPLDAQLHVLDEGSPVRWMSINETDHPF